MDLEKEKEERVLSFIPSIWCRSDLRTVVRSFSVSKSPLLSLPLLLLDYLSLSLSLFFILFYLSHTLTLTFSLSILPSFFSISSSQGRIPFDVHRSSASHPFFLFITLFLPLILFPSISFPLSHPFLSISSSFCRSVGFESNI